MKQLKSIVSTPKTYEELVKNIEVFITTYNDKVISPRYFRVAIGVSKATLSNWKSIPTRQKWFDLIKTYEDLLLANIEQETINLATEIQQVEIQGISAFQLALM